MEKLTGRERVLKALEHEETDYVPIDLGGSWNSTVTAPFYERLKKHFYVESPTEVVDRMMQVCQIDEAILHQLQIDTRAVYYNPPELDSNMDVELGENRYRDKWGCEWIKPKSSYYYDLDRAPLAGEITVEEIKNHPWPEPNDPGYTRGLRSRVERMRADTDCALLLNLSLWVLQGSQVIRGYQDWFMDVAAAPHLLEFMADCMTEVMLGPLASVTEEIGDLVDVILVSDDLGHQDRLCISPQSYRKIFKPRHARMLDAIKSRTRAKILWHTCGSVITVLDDLIDMGVDAINPVQTTAKDMEPERLKGEFGDKLAFWGGIDTMNVLNNGTTEDVRREVKYKIEQFAPGGGYVLNPVHNVQPDVPVENILAMIDAAKAYGRFPIGR